MHGKTLVITGATSGIGEVAAIALAGKGARVVFTARNRSRAEQTLAKLKAANPTAQHDWVEGDLTTIAEMKSVGQALAAKAPTVDVLINNAGAIFDTRQLTADGLEQTFAVNHMAYFIITELLRPNLAGDARIVSTASTAHQAGKLDFTDLAMERSWSAMGAYGRSKLCNILWTRELARRLQGSGVTANCIHPGGVATNFGDNLQTWLKPAWSVVKLFMRTPEKGADTLIWLSTADAVKSKSGLYWFDRKDTKTSAAGADMTAAARLWDVSAALSGLG